MLSTTYKPGPGEPTAWWNCPSKADVAKNGLTDEYCAHVLLFEDTRALEEDQIDIHYQNILNAKLYSNRELMAFEWTGTLATSFRPLKANLENVIQSVVDTLRARFATNRPRAKVVTRGADFDVYRKGRLLDRWLWGEFLHHKLWAKMEVVTKDSMVYGTGWLKHGIDGKETFVERVNPDEMIVDQRECVSNDMPLCLRQRKLVSRLWLQETFGSDAAMHEHIATAQAKGWTYTSYRTPSEDQIVLIEAWKRPTRPGGSDGRHVIAIENCTLVDQPYKRDGFPFVWLKWRDPESGFYGLPLVSDLIGYQIRQDEMQSLIQRGQEVMCVPRLAVEEGSSVQVSQLDNQVGKIVNYRGTEPKPLIWPAFHPELYAERDRNKSSAYEFSGVSEALAQAKPLSSQQRFDSAPAQREFQQAQDTRFNHFVQRGEEAYLAVAEGLVADGAELYTGQKIDRATSYLSHNLVQQIPWSKVDMDRDRYVLQVAASSVINMSPAARTDKLEGMLAEGKITIDDYYAMSGDPDLERLTDRKAAKTDHVESMIDQMLDGVEQTPTQFDDLDVTIPIVHDELLRLLSIGNEADGTNVPTDIIYCFVQWLELAKELKAPAITQPAMAPGVNEAQVAGGMPPGPPPPQGPPAGGLGMTGVAVDPAIAAQFSGVPVAG